MYPQLIQIFGYKIYSYPLFYGLAWGYLTFKAKEIFSRDISRKKYFWLVWAIIFLSAWIGAKILFVLINFNLFFNQVSFPNKAWASFALGGGLVFYGGFVSCGLAICILNKFPQFFTIETFKTLIPYIPMAHAIGRLGCFMAGCCFGKPLSRSFTFIDFEFTRIPVQIIEAALLVVFSRILILINTNKIPVKMGIIDIYILFYSIIRFCLEFLRDDLERGVYYSWISTSQIVALVLISIIIIKNLFLKKRFL